MDLKLGSLGDIQWQKTYGGTRIDYIQSVQQTTDAGYVLAVGPSHSELAHGFLGIKVGHLVRLNAETYGGTESDQAQSIQQTRMADISWRKYVVRGFCSSRYRYLGIES